MATPDGPPPSFPGYAPRPQIRFDAIGEAWCLVKQQLGTWIVAVLVYFVIVGVIQGVLSLFTGGMQPTPRPGEVPNPGVILGRMFAGPNALASIIGTVVNVLLTAGLYRLGTKQVRGEQIQVGDMFSVTDVFGSLIIASILVTIATFLGFFACCIGALVVGALFMLTVPLIVDQRLDALAAMRASWDALKKDALIATLFYFVAGFVGAIGILACCVGIFVTFPITIVSICIVYRDFFLASVPPAAPPAAGPMAPPPIV